LQHARKAVALAPDYPPNEMALGEALAATEDMQGARGAYERALEMARRQADTGEPDASEWIRQAGDALTGLSNH
jgi:Tfp pilus assembly protein PilF